MSFWTSILAGHFSVDPILALQLAERELMLFALFWIILGFFDELAIDLLWLAMRLCGKIKTASHVDLENNPLQGKLAVFVAAWQEAEVIGTTIFHMLKAWPQQDMRLYIGCYTNDPATLEVATRASQADPRVRLVIVPHHGPTTKADCLNRLYQAMVQDEKRTGRPYRGMVLHDAEDMVHPQALGLIDSALNDSDFVQLPVRPEPSPQSRWIAGHYCDEFTEAHAKAMVVRDALGAAIPSAGVGAGFARAALEQLVWQRRGSGNLGPFAAECLTEDYELGLRIAQSPERRRFLRLRDAAGALIATRSYFPCHLSDAVRQKTRWVHGIAFQGWERLGWVARPIDFWMRLRDRRGPLTALVLTVAYILLPIEGLLYLAYYCGLSQPIAVSPMLAKLMALGIFGLVWRVIMRFAFTTREYGWRDGLLAVLRIPIANVIAIMAGRRALISYLRELWHGEVRWDKTDHHQHPAIQEATA